jgi:hypothetical protein
MPSAQIDVAKAVQLLFLGRKLLNGVLNGQKFEIIDPLDVVRHPRERERSKSDILRRSARHRPALCRR